MKFIPLIVIAVLIPILTPFCINLYIAYVPGLKVGSIDGWLSYLGGYSGGILAFLSAYTLFYKQKSISDRCWITLNILDISEHKEPRLAAIYSNSTIDNFDFLNRSVKKWEPYGVAIVEIKNVSKNYAKNIQIDLVGLDQRIEPLMHIENSDKIRKYAHISELEAGASLKLALHIDPSLYRSKTELTLKIFSRSIYDVGNSQNIKLHKKEDGFSLGLE